MARTATRSKCACSATTPARTMLRPAVPPPSHPTRPSRPSPSQMEKVDLNTIHRIKEEALGRNSKVMDHAFYLTDVNGPRLQSSKGYRAAADWAVKRLQEYGLSNVHLEKWAPFGKGWNLELYSGHRSEEHTSELQSL